MTPSPEGQEAPGAFLDRMLADFAARHRQTPKRPHRGRAFACRRLTAIERLIYGRHRGPVDTDDGQAYVEAALPYIAANAARHRRPITLAAWAKRLTPRFYAEAGPAWFQGRETSLRGFAFPTADQIARQLAVTYAEVRAFGLTTIGAVDRGKAQRLVERREKDRERKRLARLAAGMTPRAEALATAKPWTASGMSRSAWYAAGKPVALVAPAPWTDLSALFIGDGVRTKPSRGSATAEETTTATPWELAGVSRRTWFRHRAAAAAAAAVVPDPAPAIDTDDVPQAPAVVLEIGRVVVDAVQLATWQARFPGVDVLAVVKADAFTLNQPDNENTPWQDMAETYLSYEHFRVTTTPANEDENIGAEAV